MPASDAARKAHHPPPSSGLVMPETASTKFLEVALRDQALNITLPNVELAVLGQIDRPEKKALVLSRHIICGIIRGRRQPTRTRSGSPPHLLGPAHQ